MKVTKKPTVLLERFPYRYIQVGKLEINDMPDCRIQKVDTYHDNDPCMNLLFEYGNLAYH